MLDSSVRGDHERAWRNGGRRLAHRGRSASYDHHDFLRHAFLRWHYPGQVLRVGGAICRPLSPAARAPRYARYILAPAAFVERLAAARIGDTFNQYAGGARARLLRARLEAYLEARHDAEVLLVGEAAGYRGARVSGIPFTSERQLSGRGSAEATATIVHRVVDELGLEERVLLWNVVPTHPHRRRDSATNRPPTAAEVELGRPFVNELARGRRVVAVGRLAERELGAPYVRHPSHGGGSAFRAGLLALVTDL